MAKQRFVSPVIILTVILTIIGGAIPAAGQDDTEYASPLLAMLALAPDNELTNDGSGWATVRFSDFQAYFIAEGIEELRQTMDIETLFDTIPVAGLSRISAGPRGLQYMLAVMGEMDQLVGFEWFEDAVSSLEFGQPPYEGLILGGDFDADAIAAALSTRETGAFEQTEVDGVTVWHRFDDGSVNVVARDPGDPFGGELGSAARIAILPGYLANGRFWGITEMIIATAQGEQDSLADNADYRALAEAITAPDGVLIQALFFNVVDIGFIPDEPMIADTDHDSAKEGYGPLMPYTLAVLADRQEGNDQVHLIGLVYPNADLAADAAEEVARRVSTFTLPRSDFVPVEEYGATVSTRVVESDSGAVALVEARYPLPENRIDPDSGMFLVSGLMFRLWVNATNQRAFFLLQVSAE